MAKLNQGFAKVALKLQEAATVLSHNDIRARLSDALKEQNPGTWCYIVDIYGDDESGDLVYSCNDDLMKCSYEISQVDGKAAVTIDCENATDVYPVTTYVEELDEHDQMAATMEALVTEKLYTEAPLYERFVSKTERDSMDSADFAGKGKSFPIRKPEDVQAAVHAMGRAGSGNLGPSGIKARIIAIAKRKGWTSSLPKAWRDGGDSGDSKESKREIDIYGDVVPLIALREASAVASDGTTNLKLISPGLGSSGFYSRALLERDGPQVFTRGTKMFWNHQTATEESQRPEGDLRDLASELVEDARWDANGMVPGPGLYARAKVFEGYRKAVNELAPHIGVSIRALGIAKPGEAEGKKGQIVEKLSRAQSVDYVTQAGAGGQILQLFEAARPSATIPHQQEGADAMTDAELKKLQESVTAAQADAAAARADSRKANQRLALFEARDYVAGKLKDIRLPEATRARLIERLIGAAPMDATTGLLDTKAFGTLIEAEVKDEAEYLSRLTEGRIVTGMGSTPAPNADPAAAAAQADKDFETGMREVAKTFGMTDKSGQDTFVNGLFQEGR